MAKGKWGESFLKSGLPLEHLTQVTFRNLGWYCSAHSEYVRPNREGKPAWFEIDLQATSLKDNGDTELTCLIECKYHEESRYWMLLPHLDGRWMSDDRVLNCGPLQTLRSPRKNNLLPLASLSTDGIVVSEDGQKQDNAVKTAIQQVTSGFIHAALSLMYSYNIDYENSIDDPRRYVPNGSALVPVVVTNARLFRLRPSVSDLAVIRNAATPADIADEVPWTWYYNDVSVARMMENDEAIEQHKAAEGKLVHRYHGVAEHLDSMSNRPNWVAVVNINHLAAAVNQIEEAFLQLPTKRVASLVRPPKQRRKLKLNG